MQQEYFWKMKKEEPWVHTQTHTHWRISIEFLAIAKPIISRRNYISYNMSLDTHLLCVCVRVCLSRLATCIIHKFESLFNGSLSRMVSKYLDHALNWTLIKIVLKVKCFTNTHPFISTHMHPQAVWLHLWAVEKGKCSEATLNVMAKGFVHSIKFYQVPRNMQKFSKKLSSKYFQFS